ncbi:MAG: hydroxyacid dehydrogenase [Candidatus Marinimicrobia bacterium]|jgi:D-3-phosphoglycerate dehydrogenase|nr:hydroxyacid dehydrogenase [Candidatus Neomarinimicrobiota bacterium]MBT4054050.1 hydroxyacid dehydrogenase [Candidatus Neomarinimicrobiota bacterium]MBT4661099.1 hydroxyacid dehydrogenase [Candidatus Neomarinimicrobiota bacterium]
MKILIADKLSPKAILALEKKGANITSNPNLKAEELSEAINNANILIVRSTKVFAETIEAGKSLELIIRAGAGVNNIDLEKASSSGVYVANCPGKNSDAVAELALGHIIACDRRIVDASLDLRSGNWKKKAYQNAAGLKGRTLGIIGLGSIGRALAKLAKGLNMRVIAWSRSLTPDKADKLDLVYCESIDEVAANADVISVHLAVTPDTKHLLNTKFFNKMKDEAIFVNTSRGEIVDTAALHKAIDEKTLRVGLDVFENEPGSGLAEFDQTDLAGSITCTPHIAASTNQASEAIADEVVRIVDSLIKTGKPINAVNSRNKTEDGTILMIRHYNRVGVLASVLDALREAEINVEDMENNIFHGSAAAIASLKLDKTPSEDVISEISSNESIIQVSIK